jgi:multiple sugar transport system permease protein
VTATTAGAATASTPRHSAAAAPRRRVRPARVLLHGFLILTAVVWLIPVLWAVLASLRPYSETQAHGYFSIPHSLSFKNFTTAWTNADLPRYYWNTLIVTVPALLLTLMLASFVAFGASRLRRSVNVLLLVVFTAGNLLPQQVIITPLYRMYLKIPLPAAMSDSGSLYDSYWGIIAIHVGFQVGFCVFVLSNYLRTVPNELFEAARVDGASVWRQYWQLVVPLCRPAFAALATLEFIWIYNDFFWALVLMQTSEKRPITAALANLQGQFFTNNNLVAAASLLVAIPTLTVYFVLQRQFIGGLTLGATKG